ncbi:hypoxanthine phosphoribosyltransferase [Paenibacillus chartarius]|uniref:tRNA(Ile)-lysidine synthase n=1 Tax=Paenibacillus chartarius TaxID=747481 RepID=A0ABV6DU19_9BACL
MNLIRRTERRIRAAGLLRQGDAMVVAVSGGPDSVALLHVLFALSQKPEWAWQLIVAHVDHGFRGAESASEADFVERMAAQLGLPCAVAKLDMPAELAASGDNAQAAARERRYEFLLETAQRWGAEKLALAHHADDQAETVLMRVLRGTSMSGLAGIPERRTEKKVELIRPFLRIYKSEILSYIEANNLPYVQDSSNSSLKYSRNRIRLDVIPYLRMVNPQLSEALNRLAETAADEDAYIAEQAREAFARIVRTGMEDTGAGRSCELDRRAFAGLPVALQRRLVKLILSYLISGDLVEFPILERARLAMLQEGTPHLALDLGAGCRLRREYDRIRFAVQSPLSPSPPTFEYIWREGTERLPLPELHAELRFERPAAEGTTGSVTTPRETENSAIFDGDLLEFPLTVRSRRSGDRMRPIGLNGSKKVKDIFIDEKVPQSTRDRLPIVTDAAGRILWIPGVKRSDVAAVNSASVHLVRMTLHRMPEPASSYFTLGGPSLLQDIQEVLYSEETIQNKIKELGETLSREYEGRNPLVICVLKGAFIFMADLVKRITVPIELDFMAVSSYGAATKSSGVVKIIKDLDVPVQGRDIIIVEDIIDSGLTLSYLIDVLERRNALSISVVALFDKPARRTVELEPDYRGFEIPDAFVVGYGLDYAEKYRNLPFVGILKPEIYTK